MTLIWLILLILPALYTDSAFQPVRAKSKTSKPPVWRPIPPIWTPKPRIRTPKPPIWTPKPPIWTPRPPIWPPRPPVRPRKPPVRPRKPPIWTPKPPIWTPRPPIWPPRPPVRPRKPPVRPRKPPRKPDCAPKPTSRPTQHRLTCSKLSRLEWQFLFTISGLKALARRLGATFIRRRCSVKKPRSNPFISNSIGCDGQPVISPAGPTITDVVTEITYNLVYLQTGCAGAEYSQPAYDVNCRNAYCCQTAYQTCPRGTCNKKAWPVLYLADLSGNHKIVRVNQYLHCDCENF